MAQDRSQNRRARIGAALGGAVIGVMLLVFFAADVFRRVRPSIEVVALMPQAGALEKNSEVWIAGRKVGSVVSVELRPSATDSTERVAARMSIPRKYASQIRTDSEVRVTSQRLIGAPVLDILPGSPGTPNIADGDTLRVRPSGSIEGLLNRTFALNASMEAFIADLRSIERVANAARERELRRLNQSLKGAMAEFRALTLALRNSPMAALSDPAFAAALASFNARAAQLGQALRAAADRAQRAQSDAAPSLRRLAARGDTISSVLAEIQRKIDESGGGLLVRAPKDSAIAKGLREAQVQLDSLMAETKRNPLRFWF
ncbi:MAG: MlaD family protein [Gemmatimonadota bacterium]